jgi:hypothetical protein
MVYAVHRRCPVDNDATHKHPEVQIWLARRPRVQLHVTPTDAWWLNLVETFVAITTRQALRRGDSPAAAPIVGSGSRAGRSGHGWAGAVTSWVVAT